MKENYFSNANPRPSTQAEIQRSRSKERKYRFFRLKTQYPKKQSRIAF